MESRYPARAIALAAAVVCGAAVTGCTERPAAAKDGAAAAPASAAAGAAAGTTGAAAAGSPAGVPSRAAHHFVKRGTGKMYARDGLTTEAKLTAKMTDGRYTFIDETWHPGFKVVPHFHTEHAEIFYTISGQVEWTVNGETRTLGPGDLIYIPPDTVHATRVVGDKDVQLLMIYEPGGHEEHLEDEQKYTAEERKKPEITELLRSHYDFNPTTMPKAVAAAEIAARTPPKGPGPRAIRPVETVPQPARHHFALRGKGETYTPDHEISEVKLTAADTDGRYSFVDEIWQPGMAVPLHYHSGHAETFFVLAGQVEWTVGGETQLLGAGDLVYIPPDTPHSVKVVGTADVHSLMLYSPGGYEYHWRREFQYTPAQRKEPAIQRELETLNDFNPIKP